MGEKIRPFPGKELTLSPVTSGSKRGGGDSFFQPLFLQKENAPGGSTMEKDKVVPKLS